MNENDKVIHDRNILLLKIISGCSIIDFIFNFILYPAVLKVIVPPIIGTVFVLAVLINYKKWVKQTMYASALLIYVPLIILIESEPMLVNYIFIWMGLIISSLYQRTAPVLLSSLIANILSVYYFFKFQQTIFVNVSTIDVIYIVIFNVFLTIFLVFSGRYSYNELWYSNKYLNSYYENTNDAILVYDKNGKQVKANQNFERIFGLDKVGITNKKLDFFIENERPKVHEIIKLMYETKQSQTIETLCYCKDKNVHHVILTIIPLRNRMDKITGFITIIKDTTDLKQTEEALRRSEMLSVVGQLAAGVAHEIKNPITVLSGFVQLIKQSDHHQTRQEYYKIMQTELKRILEITNELLVVGKQTNFKFKQKRIQSLIKEVVLLLKGEAEKNKVNLVLDISPDTPAVSCEPNQLKQVFINIIKNGIESMSNGGKLGIYAKLESNHTINVEIIDEGCGMTNEMISYVGTPFYTTKETGTGLGMMVSYRIIENHHGKLEIESKLNVGTKVKIQLPVERKIDFA